MKQKKILFVIPAYNEAENIAKVIEDIKLNIPKADILVVNDYSSDNTKEVAENENVICINHVFNMGYARGIQTGLKYALEKDYDLVIQFDGDGQHLAVETKKMFQKIEDTNCDIVIGSRFLEKTNYPHPLFRKLGTNIFSSLIKVFCNTKITDPTSGLQCLNKEVIKKYSKIGEYPEFPDANLIIEMLYSGFIIEEVSVQMKQREFGTSMHSGVLKPIKYMVKIFYSIIFILIQNIGRSK